MGACQSPVKRFPSGSVILSDIRIKCQRQPRKQARYNVWRETREGVGERGGDVRRGACHYAGDDLVPLVLMLASAHTGELLTPFLSLSTKLTLH